MTHAERNDLFERHRKLALWQLHRLRQSSRLLARIPYDDAVQIAYLTLLQTIETWQPEIAKLSTHLWIRLRARLQDAVGGIGVVKAPYKAWSDDRFVKQAMAGVTSREITHHDGEWMRDRSPHDPGADMDAEESSARLARLLDGLHPREQAILSEHFGGGEPYAILAAKHKISRSHVATIARQAIAKLRARRLSREAS